MSKPTCSECGRARGTEYTRPRLSYECVDPVCKLRVTVYKDPDHPDDRTKDRALCEHCIRRWPLDSIYQDQIPRAKVLGILGQARDAGIDLGVVGNTVVEVARTAKKEEP